MWLCLKYVEDVVHVHCRTTSQVNNADEEQAYAQWDHQQAHTTGPQTSYNDWATTLHSTTNAADALLSTPEHDESRKTLLEQSVRSLFQSWFCFTSHVPALEDHGFF